MPNFVLECCVDTLESAVAAEQGGATRLELCANLVIGGTTPSPFLLEQVQNACSVPVRCMVRPRFGDFCYSGSEYAIMKKEVAQLCGLGAQGVVFGILLPDGSLDAARVQELVDLAGKSKVTLHRAFDVCTAPLHVLWQAEELGIDTVLTSGAANSALAGRGLLTKLQKASRRIAVMAGGGVDAGAITALWTDGIRNFHLSGARTVQSPMIFRNPAVSMGLPALSEYERWECDKGKVAAARTVLDRLSKQ